MEIIYFMEVDEIKQLGFVNTNVNDDVIGITLVRVQDIMLKSVLGRPFYQRLREGIKNEDLTPDEENLIDEYIKPFLVPAVEYECIPHIEMEIRAKTVGTTNDATYQTVTESQSLKLEDRLRQHMNSYKEELKCYLHDNQKKFKLFDEWVCGCSGSRPEKLGGNYNNVIAFV